MVKADLPPVAAPPTDPAVPDVPLLVVSAGNAARNAMARGDLMDADAVLLDLTDANYADAPCAAMRQRMATELTDVARSIALGPAN